MTYPSRAVMDGAEPALCLACAMPNDPDPRKHDPAGHVMAAYGTRHAGAEAEIEARRRYRDVMALPDDFRHTRGSACPCRPSIEVSSAGDVIVHRRYEGDPVEQGESEL